MCSRYLLSWVPHVFIFNWLPKNRFSLDSYVFFYVCSSITLFIDNAWTNLNGTFYTVFRKSQCKEFHIILTEISLVIFELLSFFMKFHVQLSNGCIDNSRIPVRIWVELYALCSGRCPGGLFIILTEE